MVRNNLWNAILLKNKGIIEIILEEISDAKGQSINIDTKSSASKQHWYHINIHLHRVMCILYEMTPKCALWRCKSTH